MRPPTCVRVGRGVPDGKARWAPSRGAGGQQAARAGDRGGRREDRSAARGGCLRGPISCVPATQDGFRHAGGNLAGAGGHLQTKFRTAPAPVPVSKRLGPSAGGGPPPPPPPPAP